MSLGQPAGRLETLGPDCVFSNPPPLSPPLAQTPCPSPQLGGVEGSARIGGPGGGLEEFGVEGGGGGGQFPHFININPELSLCEGADSFIWSERGSALFT